MEKAINSFKLAEANVYEAKLALRSVSCAAEMLSDAEKLARAQKDANKQVAYCS